jgi:hypothetical protein
VGVKKVRYTQSFWKEILLRTQRGAEKELEIIPRLLAPPV